MASKEYSLIREEEAIDEVSTQHHNNHLRFGERRQFGSGTVSLTLAISLATNIVLVVLQLLHGRHEVSSTRTAFAGLERNKRIAWTDDSDFASHNRTTWDQAWETLKPDTGFVAISDDLAIRTGLHESQRWPWDPSKGLYLLQGYHSLHCLTILRTALAEMHDHKPQSLHFKHVNHCLDGLRQEIVCNADDTPRYSGLGQEMGTGSGQYRMCRDWGELEEWAKAHSACYEYREGVETLMGGYRWTVSSAVPMGASRGKGSLDED